MKSAVDAARHHRFPWAARWTQKGTCDSSVVCEHAVSFGFAKTIFGRGCFRGLVAVGEKGVSPGNALEKMSTCPKWGCLDLTDSGPGVKNQGEPT
jgi:hypothetical protein